MQQATTCPNKYHVETPNLRCYDAQSGLTEDIRPQKTKCLGSDAQFIPHPPVERLVGSFVNRPPRNRFAQEIFLRYPFMRSQIENELVRHYGGRDSVGITTYRGEFRDPREIIEEIEATDLSISKSAEWQPSKETVKYPCQNHCGGTKVHEWGSRKRSNCNIKGTFTEGCVQQKKKGPKTPPMVYPMVSEYRHNIDSMAKLIIDQKINKRDKVLVLKQHTLPEYARMVEIH